MSARIKYDNGFFDFHLGIERDVVGAMTAVTF